MIDRREALKNIVVIFGSALAPATLAVMLDGCKPNEKSDLQLSEKQLLVITEMAEIIIPETTSPGAKAAGVGPFIVTMINDCYPEEVRLNFMQGLENMEKIAKEKFQDNFSALNRKKQEAVVALVAKNASEQKAVKDKPGFFKLMKDLTVLGYFTSEAGATKALDYVAIPTRYDACIDLVPSKKTWAL